jgi:hypothetical protein
MGRGRLFAFALGHSVAHLLAQLHDDVLKRFDSSPLVRKGVVQIRDGLFLMGAAHLKIFETRFKLVHRVAGS